MCRLINEVNRGGACCPGVLGAARGREGLRVHAPKLNREPVSSLARSAPLTAAAYHRWLLGFPSAFVQLLLRLMDLFPTALAFKGRVHVPFAFLERGLSDETLVVLEPFSRERASGHRL